MTGNISISGDLPITGTVQVDGTITGTIQIGGGSKPVLDSITVQSTGTEQVITASEHSCDGFSEITVQAVQVGEDTLNELFNSPASATPTSFTMTDDNANHMCYGFKNGLSVTLGAGVKSFVSQAFNNDKSVKNIVGQDIEAVGSECFASSNIQSVSFPKCTSIGTRAFNYCAKLASINFPLCHTVGESAFDSCTAITTIDLPACTTIGKGAFGSMRYTSVNLPVCTSVGEGALRDFKGTTLRLPAVQTMGRQQFRYCENMTDLYLGYDGVVAVTREQQFYGWEMFPRLFSGSMTINVHVPAGQLSNYQSDTIWQDIVTSAASDNVTLTFVGDYDAQQA